MNGFFLKKRTRRDFLQHTAKFCFTSGLSVILSGCLENEASIVETATHWFIGYYDYHPLDWNLPSIHWHENDMEGVLLVINKTEGVEWGGGRYSRHYRRGG